MAYLQPHGVFKMIRRSLISISILLATGCAVHQPSVILPVAGIAHNAPKAPTQKFALCAMCPTPTPKTLAIPEAQQPQSQPVKAAPSQQFAVIPQTPPPQPQPFADTTTSVAAATKPTSHTIQFKYKSAKLQAEAQKAIDDIAAELKSDQHKGVVAVQINGYTDDIGGKGYNHRLASRRTKAVASRLKKLGVDIPIVQTAAGECCFIADNSNEANRAPNRRVEVFFLKR